MATWDSGLFDSDKAVNSIEGLISIKPRNDFNTRLADAGLRMWFGCATGTQVMRALQRDIPAMTKLPKPLYDSLAELTQNPGFSKSRDNRTSAVKKITGTHCSGWRVDPLFDFAPVKTMVLAVAEANAVTLDRVLGPQATKALNEQSLVELGVLTVLTEIGIQHAKSRVDVWANGFKAMHERTTKDRDFWEPFATRVTPAFALLRAP